MNAVDLHVHSNKSDGSFSPAELVSYALEKGLSAFALTDHDTMDGVEEALAAAAGKPIEVIPGIEFSSDYEGEDIHIVGLYLDCGSAFLRRRMENFVNGRTIRNREMCRRLTQFGMPVTYEELCAEFPDCVITRAHYARYLLSHGYTKSLKEAFDRYIGDNCPCYVPRKKITPMRAVEIVLRAGGIPVLAHPMLYHLSPAKLEQLISVLKDAGLVGIEAVYSTHTPADERTVRRLADKYGLLISGGSDFHGSAKPGLDLGCGYGRLFIPEELLTRLKEKHRHMKENPLNYRKTKILFTDLDGTLLDSGKQISGYTREILSAWSDAGHKIALCSGRDVNSVGSVRDYLNLNYPGMYLIGYNGGQIVDCETGRTLHRTALTPGQVRYVMEEADRWGLHFHTYSDTHIVSPRDDEALLFYRRVIKTPTIISRDFAQEGACEILKSGACKCMIVELHDFEKMESFRLSLLPYAKKEEITLTYSSPYYMEIFPSASGKGSAVKKLCELTGINPALAVAAGDAQNDLSMIEAAGFGIAMPNGCDELKNAATLIAPFDNDHDGLAHALYDLI